MGGGSPDPPVRAARQQRTKQTARRRTPSAERRENLDELLGSPPSSPPRRRRQAYEIDSDADSEDVDDSEESYRGSDSSDGEDDDELPPGYVSTSSECPSSDEAVPFVRTHVSKLPVVRRRAAVMLPSSDDQSGPDEGSAAAPIRRATRKSAAPPPLPAPLSTSTSPLERLPASIRGQLLSYLELDPIALMSLALCNKYLHINIFGSDTVWETRCRALERQRKSPGCATWRETYWKLWSRRCLSCTQATTAQMGLIIPHVPDRLVMCGPCQAKDGPYRVIDEAEAAAKFSCQGHRLRRTLPYKLKRVPRGLRDRFRKMLTARGKCIREFLLSSVLEYMGRDVVIVPEDTVAANIDSCLANYHGIHAASFTRELKRTAKRLYIPGGGRLSEVIRFTLLQSSLHLDDAQTVALYFDSLEAARLELEAALLASGQTRFFGQPPIAVSREVSWTELIVDPDSGIDIARCVELIKEARVRRLQIRAEEEAKRQAIQPNVRRREKRAAKRRLERERMEGMSQKERAADKAQRKQAWAEQQAKRIEQLRKASLPKVDADGADWVTPIASEATFVPCVKTGCSLHSKRKCLQGSCGKHCTGCPAHPKAVAKHIARKARLALTGQGGEPTSITATATAAAPARPTPVTQVLVPNDSATARPLPALLEPAAAASAIHAVKRELLESKVQASLTQTGASVPSPVLNRSSSAGPSGGSSDGRSGAQLGVVRRRVVQEEDEEEQKPKPKRVKLESRVSEKGDMKTVKAELAEAELAEAELAGDLKENRQIVKREPNA